MDSVCNSYTDVFEPLHYLIAPGVRPIGFVLPNLYKSNKVAFCYQGPALLCMHNILLAGCIPHVSFVTWTIPSDRCHSEDVKGAGSEMLSLFDLVTPDRTWSCAAEHNDLLLKNMWHTTCSDLFIFGCSFVWCS